MKFFIPKLTEKGKNRIEDVLGVLAFAVFVYGSLVVPSYLPKPHHSKSDVAVPYSCGVVYGQPGNTRTYDFNLYFPLNGRNLKKIEEIAASRGLEVIREGNHVVDFFYPTEKPNGVIRLNPIPNDVMGKTIDDICVAVEKAA